MVLETQALEVSLILRHYNHNNKHLDKEMMVLGKGMLLLIFLAKEELFGVWILTMFRLLKIEMLIIMLVKQGIGFGFCF